jgi:hypothetical protein
MMLAEYSDLKLRYKSKAFPIRSIAKLDYAFLGVLGFLYSCRNEMFTTSIVPFSPKPASPGWIIPLAITRSSSQKCPLSTLLRGGEVFLFAGSSASFDSACGKIICQ